MVTAALSIVVLIIGIYNMVMANSTSVGRDVALTCVDCTAMQEAEATTIGINS